MPSVQRTLLYFVLFALLWLAGCGGGSMGSSGTSFQLSVQPSGSGKGTVSSNPAGIDCGPTCSGMFSSGTAISLSATPASGSTFTGWSGACTGSGPCKVTLDSNATVTANFVVEPVLSVTVGGNGAVTSSPSGINCGTTCKAAFAPGTQVTLTATPASGFTFQQWQGACTGTSTTCNLTITNNVSATAVFSSQQPQIVLTFAGTGSGTVTSNPGGINCTSDCSAGFPQGTQVTLTETPGTNMLFGGWGGDCASSGTNSTCTLSMDQTHTVTVTFNVPQTVNVLNHIIFMAQENRSFDHYFGAMRKYWADNGYPDQPFDGLPQFNPGGSIPSVPGCDPNYPYLGRPPAQFQDCVYDPNNQVQSYPLTTQCLENPSPSWNESHADWNYANPSGYNNGTPALDGFVWTAGHDLRNEDYFGNGQYPYYDFNGIRAMGYYTGDDLNYYYFMATMFATSDAWFSPVMSRTELNREYLLGATSGGYAHPQGSNQYDSHQITSPIIFELLQNAGISWKIYVDPRGSVCENNQTPDCFYKYLTYIHTFTYGQTILQQYPQNIAPMSEYINDLKNGTLPAVALIEAASAKGLDEHPADYDTDPPCCSIQAGAANTEQIINAFMTSSSWKDSAFILTFDEFGGFYDHVAPQPMPSPDGTNNIPVDLFPGDVCTKEVGDVCDFNHTGYRVPLIVISPYAQKNYVSHTVADYTAILKLIETRFGLGSLTKRDAAQIDMTEFFNFNNPPWMTPPTPPSQNVSGPCYLDKLP
jgi:phospholipase C